METSSNSPILVIDDDVNILLLMKEVFSDEYDLLTADNSNDCFQILKNEDIKVVVIGDKLEKDNGIIILQNVKIQYPNIRRILISGALDVDSVVDSVNLARVHAILRKPFTKKELNELLNEQLIMYNLINKKEISKEHLYSANNQLYLGRYQSYQENLLNMLISISESKQYDDFSTLFVSVIKGMKSLVQINLELYLETRDKEIGIFAKNTITDIDLIANQYKQHGLMIYVRMLQGYFYILTDKIEMVRGIYNDILLIRTWTDPALLSPSLNDSIDNFPKHILDGDSELSGIMIPSIEMKVRKLLKIPLEDMVFLNPDLFRYSVSDKGKIQFIIIIRDDLEVYSKSIDQETLTSLVANFVIALSQFLHEVVKGSGDLNTITYEGGVILFEKIQNIYYVLFTSSNQIIYRIGLHQFSLDTQTAINSIPLNILATGKIRTYLDLTFERIFESN